MAWLGAISIFLILISIGVTTMPILEGLQAWWLSGTFFALAIAWLIVCVAWSKQNKKVQVRQCELYFNLRSFLLYKTNPAELNPNLELRVVFYRPNPFPFGTEKRYIKNNIKLSWLNVDEAKKLDCYFTNIHRNQTFQCQGSETKSELLLEVGETPFTFILELGAGNKQGKLLKGLSNNEEQAMNEYYKIERIGEELSNNFRISWPYMDGKKGDYKVRLRDEL